MMEKGLKYLSDIFQAIVLIEDFTKSITSYTDYPAPARLHRVAFSFAKFR